jgi:molecular chaperone GrpE (heat shock protein)
MVATHPRGCEGGRQRRVVKPSQEKDQLIKAQGEKIEQLTEQLAELRDRLARLEQATLAK